MRAGGVPRSAHVGRVFVITPLTLFRSKRLFFIFVSLFGAHNTSEMREAEV